MAIIPNKNLKIHEIRDAINGAGGKADNTFGSLFKKENINFYSLEKPMSVKNVSGVTNFLFELSEDDKRKCNYGYTMPEASDIDELTGYIRDSKIPFGWENSDLGWGWFYNPPTGGAEDPYRVADFKGYNSLQKTTFTFFGESTINQLENIYTVAGRFPFASFSYFENMYVGLLFAKKGTSIRGSFFVTNIKISESNGVDVTIDETYSKALFGNSSQNNGDIWYIAPFLSPEPNIQNIISSEDNYLSNVTGAKTIPVSIVEATYQYIGTTASDPMNGIKFSFNVKEVTNRQVVMECTATNTGSQHTMNLNIMRYTVELESYNVDVGQYKLDHEGEPSASLFDTLVIPNGTSIISENMRIGYYPYDDENNPFETPYYITIHFASYMVDSVSGKDTFFALGTARILFTDSGNWEQV